MLCFRAW